MHDRLARARMAYDLIGFQTESDVQRFRDYVLREAGGSADGDRLSAYGRTVVAKAFPIGIDAEQFAEMAARDEARKDAEIGRAACRERVCEFGEISVVYVFLKKTEVTQSKCK